MAKKHKKPILNEVRDHLSAIDSFLQELCKLTNKLMKLVEASTTAFHDAEVRLGRIMNGIPNMAVNNQREAALRAEVKELRRMLENKITKNLTIKVVTLSPNEEGDGYEAAP